METVKPFVYKFYIHVECPAGLFYHSLFSKQLCHKPLSSEQAQARSQHMPSADVT